MLLRCIENEDFLSIRRRLKSARFKHLSDVNYVRVLRVHPSFHLIEELWRPKLVSSHILIGRKLEFLSKLSISIVALLLMTFELFESILILAS